MFSGLGDLSFDNWWFISPFIVTGIFSISLFFCWQITWIWDFYMLFFGLVTDAKGSLGGRLWYVANAKWTGKLKSTTSVCHGRPFIGRPQTSASARNWSRDIGDIAWHHILGLWTEATLHTCMRSLNVDNGCGGQYRTCHAIQLKFWVTEEISIMFGFWILGIC